MKQRLPLRIRMMLTFCTVVGVLLSTTLCILYVLFGKELDSQINCRLLKAGRPMVARLASNSNTEPKDVDDLNVPDEYFEVVDASGQVLQRSKNLPILGLKLGGPIDFSKQAYRSIDDGDLGSQRVVLIPFQRPSGRRILAVAMPSRRDDAVLMSFRRLIMWILPISLLVTASISAWYVGRSLRPVTELTVKAARMTELVGQASPGTGELTHVLENPSPVANSRDELNRLAFTFNRLFNRVDVVLRQLRQFVTDASHELRTPLAVLRGETELLLSKPRTVEEYQTTVRVMDGELRKLTRIVEGLFTLSMADSGQLRLIREPLYLDEVVEQACTRVAPLAQTKRISIRRNLTRDLSYFGDEAFLQELGVIFLDNAIKYSPCDTEIQVQLEQVGSQIQIKFQDQGYGIANEDRPHIFERFFRGHHSGGSESRSGGLGLAIAKALVDAQNGSIECASTLGYQTTFTVTLPYFAGPAEDTEADKWSPDSVFELTDVPDGDRLTPVV